MGKVPLRTLHPMDIDPPHPLLEAARAKCRMEVSAWRCELLFAMLSSLFVLVLVLVVIHLLLPPRPRPLPSPPPATPSGRGLVLDGPRT
eukprot:753740-Hanusia_phi.AAC.1